MPQRSEQRGKYDRAIREGDVTAPIKPTVTIADVERLDVRVGTIVAVEDVPKSAKLLRLRVDFGDHARTILAVGPSARGGRSGSLTGR